MTAEGGASVWGGVAAGVGTVAVAIVILYVCWVVIEVFVSIMLWTVAVMITAGVVGCRAVGRWINQLGL